MTGTLAMLISAVTLAAAFLGYRSAKRAALLAESNAIEAEANALKAEANAARAEAGAVEAEAAADRAEAAYETLKNRRTMNHQGE